MIKKIVSCISVVVCSLAMMGCHQRVERVSTFEQEMNCAQLRDEIRKAEDVRSEIDSNRGISGRNALGLLFWPSIVINEVTGESAEKEVNNRISALKDIYGRKQCSREDVAKG